MNGILIFIIVVLVLLALALYACEKLPFLQQPIKGLIQVILVVIAIIFIAQRAGVF